MVFYTVEHRCSGGSKGLLLERCTIYSEDGEFVYGQVMWSKKYNIFFGHWYANERLVCVGVFACVHTTGRSRGNSDAVATSMRRESETWNVVPESVVFSYGLLFFPRQAISFSPFSYDKQKIRRIEKKRGNGRTMGPVFARFFTRSRLFFLAKQKLIDFFPLGLKDFSIFFRFD